MPNLDLDAIEAAFSKCADKDWAGGLTTLFAVNGLVVLGETLVARVRELEAELANLGSACDKFLLAEKQAKKEAYVMAKAMEWWRNVARGTPRPPISRTTIARFLALVEAEHRIADLADDNAALRLAATELYELVVDASKSAGIDPSYGPIRRMANVLGIKKEGDDGDA